MTFRIIYFNFKNNNGRIYRERGLFAEVDILNTTQGKILQELLKMNSLVLRTRGMGGLDDNGYVENYKLITCDFINKSKDSFSTSEIKKMSLNKKLKKVKAT